MDLVIRNGEVVTASGRMRCDVGIQAGRIVALEENLAAAREDIDASGLLVLPGGVEGHCHVEQRSSTGLMTADDFRSAGISAACGGTTTLIPFAAQHRGQSLEQVVADYHLRAEAGAFIDYAFHLIVSDPGPKTLREELPRLIEKGYTSFKLFMTYDALRLNDRQCLDILALAAQKGALTLVHAENHEMISWLTERLLSQGYMAPRFHADSRPVVAEREAVQRILSLAEIVQAPLFIVHVSCAEVLEEIRMARIRGQTVFSETCPQYLLLTAADMDRPGFEGAKFMCSPPLRTKADQEALWQALADGTLDVLASDHAGYRYDDPQGKKVHGDQAPFNKVPNGVPGIELRLPLFFSEGVNKGRISLERFVELTSETPARIYGLFPQKGTIALGCDADIAIWDPLLDWTIGIRGLHDHMDYTPYEGLRIRGRPVTVLSRGEIIVRDGKVFGNPGRGKFIARGRVSV